MALVGHRRRLMPRVTVVTATYNWAAVLPFCIASVRAQTFGDFQHLVVGDGCTDESAEVVVAAADGDPRIRWVNLASNTGHQWGPNNEGIRLADSDVIAYLGHDDLWLANHLENLVAALDASGAGLVHSSTLFVHPSAAPSRLARARAGATSRRPGSRPRRWRTGGMSPSRPAAGRRRTPTAGWIPRPCCGPPSPLA